MGQKRNHDKLSEEKHNKLANDIISKGGYYGAIDHLEELLKKYPENKDLLMRLADAHFNSRNYVEAAKYYAQVKEKEGKVPTMAGYRLGESLKYNGEYSEAKRAFQDFTKVRSRDKKINLAKRKAKYQVLSCEYALSRPEEKKDVKITHLGEHVNSAYSEFAPRFANDSVLIFSSLRADSVITVGHDEIHYHQVQLYKAELVEHNKFGEPEALPLNRKFEQTANGSFSPDGSRFFFTRCNKDRNHQMKCRIYESKVVNGEFEKAKKVKGINKPGTHNTMPIFAEVISRKRKIELLYFVSDRRGYGGLDIFASIVKKDGSFSTPKNLGKKINSPGNEISPYFDGETGILYFSSDFLKGYGGFDVFSAKGTITKFGSATNMGKPINSSLDDTYYSIGEDHFSGFLTSNRPGGTHLLHETCCDDIYAFDIEKPAILVVNLFDTSFTNKFNLPLDGITVLSSSLQEESDSNFVIKSDFDYDTVQGQDDKLLLSRLNMKTDNDNYFRLEPGLEYKIVLPAKDSTQQDNIVTLTVPSVDDIDADTTGDNKSAFKMKKDDNVNLYTLDLTPFFKEVPKDTVKEDTVVEQTTLADVYKELTTDTVVQPMVDTTIADSVVKPIVAKKIKSWDFNVNFEFEFDAADLRGRNLTMLDSVVTIMLKRDDINVNLTTHTDALGSDAYNMSLSNRRAAFIANFMIKKGIPKSRIEAKGLGETKHIAPNKNEDGSDNPEGRRKNRRTEIRFFTKSE